MASARFSLTRLRRRLAWGGALAAIAIAAHAQDAPPPRQIAPDRFAPTPRDAATISAPHPIAPDPSAPHDATPNAPARTPIVMPTRDRPVGACDRAARDWIVCLDGTARLSDRAVAEEQAHLLAGLDRRPRLNPVTREGIGKALTDVNDAWRSLRDRECAELALIERGLADSYYEARLVCRIRRNLERAETLAARYEDAP